MNGIKKVLGIVWILLALATACFGVAVLGLPKFATGKQEDLVFGIIIMIVLTPIITGGLLIFGKYALSGEYDTKD
jgi:energy-converting hydrogenase Eha subunit A